jgi:hypothetical protein
LAKNAEDIKQFEEEEEEVNWYINLKSSHAY